MMVRGRLESVFWVFSSIVGKRGWPSFTALWQLRGTLDRLAGGVGMRRGGGTQTNPISRVAGHAELYSSPMRFAGHLIPAWLGHVALEKDIT